MTQCKSCAYSTGELDSCGVFVRKPGNCWAHATMAQKDEREAMIAEYTRRDKRRRDREHVERKKLKGV